ncbi:PREDICTED: integrin beta-1-A-like [Cyprinodon variegatus]|uniref:integrin beta-1-A-like n=1 Tax=Cyprinodon variegatus TaxID=28743 RepID=UPI0007426480|nr:PREDICTED: integrin beta-1-A-like [Cyprinodon variegatus]
MAVKLLFLWLLLLQFSLSWTEEQRCLKYASSCDQCILAGSECAWCTSPGVNIRCATTEHLQSSGCPRSQIYNPTGRVWVLKNVRRADQDARMHNTRAVFLEPQEVSVYLRPGVPELISLTISTAPGHPTPELIIDLSNAPAEVNVTLSNIVTDNPRNLQVSVEVSQCPSKSGTSNQNRTGPWSILITPRGFSEGFKLEISLMCECNCTGNCAENSPECNGHGALVNGHCECHTPYFGVSCQIKGDAISYQDEERCRSRPNEPVCSGRGSCVEGICECNKRENPKEAYSGRYCECSNFNCPHLNNRLCGGNGRCECGRCQCESDWIGEDCSCSMQTASCLGRNQILCSGRGLCDCGKCQCDPPYSGPTCEDCPACQGFCQELAACVECRAFGTGVNKDT